MLAPSSNLVVNVAASASLTVIGAAVLNGTLTLLAAGPGTTTVLTAGSISGQFAAVAVVPQFANCSAVTGAGTYTATTLTVTVMVPPCDGGGRSIATIIGICVGIIGGAIVFAIVGVLIHRHRSNTAMFEARSKISSNQNLVAMKTTI